MNPNILESIFHAHPWAISVTGWRGVLGLAQGTKGPVAAAPRAESPAIQEAKRRKIGVMSISGPMVKGVPQEICDWYGLCNTDAIHGAAAAAKREGIETLVVHLDSPGGMVCGTAEAADALHDLRKGGMNLVGFTDTMACSAAYWLAASCNDIVATPSALVGSIGVICQVVDASKMYESAGIEVAYFVNEGSEAKLYGRSGLELSADARASFQESVNKGGVRFKAHVAAGRPSLAVENMDGNHWAAEDAPPGYVDAIRFPDGRGGMRSVRNREDLISTMLSV